MFNITNFESRWCSAKLFIFYCPQDSEPANTIPLGQHDDRFDGCSFNVLRNDKHPLSIFFTEFFALIKTITNIVFLKKEPS